MRHPSSMGRESRNAAFPPCETDYIADINMSSDGETSTIHTLPPHIAARFYRSSTNRRKSSAHSSRRNSISSLHSNRSNRSCHGGPQSTHIAQHLRRASIIESRKARLADKAAHAEQVRLRAALAKAAPRTCSTREDRALAAQQARERYLAQVAANCAEEVKRARKVAEETRERKAAENMKLRDDMAEKLAEAEKRRILYQQNLRRSRFPTLQPVEEKKAKLAPWRPRTEQEAAKIIQKAWVNFRRKLVVGRFRELALTVENARKMSFEQFSTCLAKEEVLSSTAKILQLYGLRDGDAGGLAETTAVRVFLSAYLVLGHPQHVLSQKGEQERDLTEKARNLLTLFERIAFKLPVADQLSLSPVQSASLSEAYGHFQTAFTAWKNHDSSILISTMVAQFVELDAIWQIVKNDRDGNVADDYKEGIQKNQVLLLARLKRLAGPEKALQLVREAVRARRKTKSTKPRVGDVRPRGAADTTGSSSILIGELPNADEIVAESSSLSGVDTIPSIPGLPNKFESLLQMIPDNRTLVHEIAIAETYRIEITKELAERQATVAGAIFDAMRNDLDRGNGDRWVLSMASSIRERLLRVVPPRTSLHTLISETLDLTLIQTQLRIGSFSYEKFFAFMNSILPKLCAPARDPEVKALAEDQSEDLIGRLAKLMRIIDLLCLDYCNYKLAVIAPSLKHNSAEYEKHRFDQELRRHNLVRTTKWWERARAKLILEHSRRPPSSQDSRSPSPPFQPTSDKIYTQGLVDLFIALGPLQADDVPETLELDRARISRIRSEILRVIVVSTILLTAKNLLKRDVRSLWRAEYARMMDLPFPSSPSSAYISIIEASHALPPAVRTSLQGTVERVLSEANACVAHDLPTSSPHNITQPVMKVLLTKLKGHVMGRLGASSAEERVRASTTASEVLSGFGCVESVVKVGAVVDEIGKVRKVDWEGHGAWLDEVAEKVQKAAEGRVGDQL